tara:strand:+ start:3906 stop:4475 length:570 start_codon:yes stop_codon:yes gene_type:complete
MMSYFNESNEAVLKKRLNFWVVTASIMIASNLMLASLSWYALLHQRVEVTPFFGNQGYSRAGNEVDVHYLNQLSENFVLTRFNISPNTVKSNHARLLNYVSSDAYHDLSKALLKEQALVLKNKISSYFDIESVQSNPERLTTRVTGVLKRYVGNRALPEIKIKYRLKYRYHLGRPAIVSFEKVEDVKNA